MPNKIWPFINHNKIKVRPMNTAVRIKAFLSARFIVKTNNQNAEKCVFFWLAFVVFIYWFNRCHLCLVNHWLDLKEASEQREREKERIILNLCLCKIHYCVGAQLNYVEPLSVELTAGKKRTSKSTDGGKRVGLRLAIHVQSKRHTCILCWCIVRFPVV